MAAKMAISPTYATSNYLSWYPGFYQKTTYYCLVAVVQSIAYFDVDRQFYYDLGSGSIEGGQNKIYNGYYDPILRTYHPGIISSMPPGADDSKAVAWLNNQFTEHNVTSWFYLAVTPTGFTDLMNKIHYDVGASYEPTYIRVDLSTASGTGYMWYQARNPTTHAHPLHATLAVGYDDSGKTLRSYDPFAHPVSSSCSVYYNKANDWGCNWTIPGLRYYAGMDRTMTNPIWY
jgi:hypothetical protein